MFFCGIIVSLALSLSDTLSLTPATVVSTKENAPVTFKEAGIRSLILDNANRNIPADIGHLEIMDSSFPVQTQTDHYGTYF